MTKFKSAVFTSLALIAGIAAFTPGCASSQPTGLERALYSTVTNYVTVEKTLTNVVQQTVQVPQVVTVTVTNVDHQVIETWQTNQVTQLVQVTNVTPITVTNPVVSLAGPSGLSKTLESGAGTVTNLFAPGFGTLLSSGLGGLLLVWMAYRNKKLSGNNSALSAGLAATTQIIETAREIMGSTSQGSALADQFTAWMQTHQAQTGTINAIAQIVKSEVDNGDAKDAAAAILKLMSDPKGSATTAKA